MTILIERLRGFDLTRQFAGGQHPLMNEAADEIERLTAEVRHLRERRNSAHKRYMRLRAALEKIAGWEATIPHPIEIAREALKGEDDGQE